MIIFDRMDSSKNFISENIGGRMLLLIVLVILLLLLNILLVEYNKKIEKSALRIEKSDFFMHVVKSYKNCY